MNKTYRESIERILRIFFHDPALKHTYDDINLSSYCSWWIIKPSYFRLNQLPFSKLHTRGLGTILSTDTFDETVVVVLYTSTCSIAALFCIPSFASLIWRFHFISFPPPLSPSPLLRNYLRVGSGSTEFRRNPTKFAWESSCISRGEHSLTC